MVEKGLKTAEGLLEACYAAKQETAAAKRFTEWQQHMEDWLYGHAWFRLRRWPEANRAERVEEVTQGVLLRVWQTWKKPSTRWQAAKGSLPAWLDVLVIRTITDLHRLDRRFGARPFSQLMPVGTVGFEATVADPNATPADDVARADLLSSFLLALPERDRTMLEMKLYQNLTQGQMAILLGLSDAAVSRRLGDLLTQLAAHLGFGSV